SAPARSGAGASDGPAAGGGGRVAGAAHRWGALRLGGGGLKKEGRLLGRRGGGGVLAARSPRRWRIAGCALLPAGAIAGLGRVLSGDAPLRDFDFGLIARPAELPGRLMETVRAGVSDVLWPAGPGLLCVLVLF